MDVRSLLVRLGFVVDEHGEKAIDHVSEKLDHLRHRLEIIAGAEIIKGLFELSERFGGMGEQLEQASTAAGLTAEQFQALAYAAAQNGVSQDEMSLGLARLSRSLYDAKKGGKEASQAFAEAGISADQVSGLHDARDAFLLLSDTLGQIEDPIQRVAVLQSLMGRGSYKLVKFAVQGSQAVKSLEKNAYDIGAVVKNHLVENLAQSEDAMSGFRTVIRAVVAELGARFAPNVIAVTHALEQFWVRNRAIIMTKLDDWFYDVGFAIGATYAAFQILGDSVASFIRNNPQLVSVLVSVAKYLIAVSAGMEVVHLVVGKTKLAFVALKGILELFLTPWRALLFVAGGIQTALSAIILRVAILSATRFPVFADALLTVGAALSSLPVSAVAIALAAIGAAVYTAIEMWNGKSFAETRLGRSLSWLLDVMNSIRKGLYNLTGGIFGSIGSKVAGLEGAPEMFPEAAYGGLKAQASAGFGVAASAPFNYAPPSFARDVAMAPSQNMSVAINVNGAQQPQAIAQQISDALSAHSDQMNRRNMSYVQTALVH